MPITSESARAQWAALTPEQRAARTAPGARAARFAAAKRRCVEFREHLDDAQLVELARILAPEAFRE